MSASTTVEILLPTPLPHQAEVLHNPARFKVLACGRRWGKTALGLMAVVDGQAAGLGAVNGAAIWWVAPTYKTASNVIWPDLKRCLRNAWVDKSEQDHAIYLPGGGSITVRSADNPDSLRGAGLDGLVLDEAAFCEEYVWKDVLRPMLADRQGWAIFPSTPNGKNWFYELFRRGGVEPGWASWQRPTSDNPTVPASELEAARVEGPRTFRQEYLADFTEMEGAEWPAEFFEDHIYFEHWPQDLWLKAIALDPSKGKEAKFGDYSAFVLIGLDKDNTLWVDADIARRHPTEIVERGIELYKDFRPTGFAIETNQFQEMLAADFMRLATAKGITIPLYGITNTVKKQIRIRSLGAFLAQRRLRVKGDSRGGKMLVQQLADFPVGDFDDGPDALEMGVRLLDWLIGDRDMQNQPVVLRA